MRFLLALRTFCYAVGMRILLFFAAMMAMNSSQLVAEPIYQGKPESDWVNSVTNLNSYETQKDWRKLGTNALAVLLKAIDARGIPNADLIRSNAASALQHYSDPAVLVPIARHHFDPLVRALALSGLVFNGEESVTAVEVESLRDTNAVVRNASISGLELAERQFIPGEFQALVKCLQDSDPFVRTSAAMILGDYQRSRHANPSNDDADATTYSEIMKAAASTNACIKEAANIALNQVNQSNVLPAYARELWLSTEKLTGTNWTATVRVIDEHDNPIADADASVEVYIHDLDLCGHIYDRTEKIKGKTDTNGVFSASRKGFYPSAFSAAKNGFAPARSSAETLAHKDNESDNWNPKVTLVLKKKDD